jgi:hypothetical protein
LTPASASVGTSGSSGVRYVQPAGAGLLPEELRGQVVGRARARRRERDLAERFAELRDQLGDALLEKGCPIGSSGTGF